ncbi:MAG: cell division protein FtsQ/DivIB [Lachnospiraceae bacterium]|nr:cell division protein FtsQ/DivIB [Lachnospiraceae bacterium]
MVYQTEREKKNRKIRWIVFLSILLFAVLTGFFCVTVCTVGEVEIEGNELYDDESIREWVQNDRYSWNTLYVYFKYRFKKTEAMPFIDTMTVDMKSPRKLSVLVYEKGPIGYLTDENTGQFIYFDKDGFVIEISTKQIEGVPQISGLPCENAVVYEKLDLSEKTLRTLLTLTQNLGKYNLHADGIVYDGSGNMSVVFGPITVKLGSEDNLTEKLVRLEKILPQIDGMAGTLHLETWTEDTTDVTFERMQ